MIYLSWHGRRAYKPRDGRPTVADIVRKALSARPRETAELVQIVASALGKDVSPELSRSVRSRLNTLAQAGSIERRRLRNGRWVTWGLPGGQK